ncbi:MAG TPA: hypothetical protein VHL57_08290 [Flavobacteriales bacterium]|jgi:hypothetical protein|nr:hypothetical protein [Flavobacteriales bacterium]
MSKLNDQRVAITKQIMEVKDPRKLEAIARYLDGQAHLEFTEAELASFEAIRQKHARGEGNATPWPELKRRLRKEIKG